VFIIPEQTGGLLVQHGQGTKQEDQNHSLNTLVVLILLTFPQKTLLLCLSAWFLFHEVI
jgi:hypothetical protein